MCSPGGGHKDPQHKRQGCPYAKAEYHGTEVGWPEGLMVERGGNVQPTESIFP